MSEPPMRSNLVLRAKAREGWPVDYVPGCQSFHFPIVEIEEGERKKEGPLS